MTLLSPLMPMDAAEQVLANIQRRSRLKFSRNQQRRLHWIIAHKGAPAIWKRGSHLPERTGCAIVMDVPTNLDVERFQRALAASAVVIVPYSEDPLFDMLKVEFYDFGTVGANGADGPHQLWWGGQRNESITSDYTANEMPLIISCYSPTFVNINKVRRLILSADSLGLSHAIAQNDTIPSWEMGAAAKVQYIWNIWTTTDRPVLWVEPDAVIHSLPSLPIAAGCDFAVHKRNNHGFDSSTLYFGRSHAAEKLLQTWYKLCVTSHGISENCLLDQAWALLASQSDIDTVWLPRSYCGHRRTQLPGEQPVILRDERPQLLQNVFGELLPTADHDPQSPSIMARGYGRTSAPEAQLVMRAPYGKNGPIIVLVHKTQFTQNSLSSGIVERIAAAFAHDSGEFSHLEIIICQSDSDFRTSVDIAGNAWIVVTAPDERFSKTTFKVFGSAISTGDINPSQPASGIKYPAERRGDIQVKRRFANVKSSETFLTRAATLRNTLLNRAPA